MAPLIFVGFGFKYKSLICINMGQFTHQNNCCMLITLSKNNAVDTIITVISRNIDLLSGYMSIST